MHRSLRVCRVCGVAEVEDVEHYLEHCVMLDDIRVDFWNGLFVLIHDHMRQRLRRLSELQIVDWLLGTEPIFN